MPTKAKTPFPSDVIAMARRVAGLADIYWAPECFPKAFDAAKENWLAALTQFVGSYSFERQGAPPIYRTYARQALESTGAGLAQPSASFARAAWSEFQRLAHANKHGTNEKVCALFPGKGTHKITAIEFVAGLGSHGHNLLAWATEMLATTRAEDAVRELLRIRGIHYKIATFYLRDVARAAKIDEKKAGPRWCFQPIDVWVRRAAMAWASPSGRVITDYWSAAEIIVDLADAAGVSGGDLNGGAWVLGSQLADRSSDPDLTRTLSSAASLEDVLAANVRWSRAIITGIEGASGATPSA